MPRVVRLNDENLWAVVDTASESMFAPVFKEQLPAEIFALCYKAHQNQPACFLESYQNQLSREIVWFLYHHPGVLAADAVQILTLFDQWRGR